MLITPARELLAFASLVSIMWKSEQLYFAGFNKIDSNYYLAAVKPPSNEETILCKLIYENACRIVMFRG